MTDTRLKELVVVLNDAVTSGIGFDKAIEGAKRELDLYNKDLKKQTFEKLYQTENPLESCIQGLTHPVKLLKRDNETGKYRLEDGVKSINLIEFSNAGEKSKDWQYQLEKLMYGVSLNIAQNLNPDTLEGVHKQNKTVEKLEDILKRNYKLSSGATPLITEKSLTSINTLLANLQLTINELFEAHNYNVEVKARKSDVRYMLQLAAKRNGTCSVKMPNLKQFADLLMDVLRLLMVENQEIHLDYQTNNK